MGNVIRNVTREEFSDCKPWLLDEYVTIGTSETPIVHFVVKAGLFSCFKVFVRRGFNFNILDAHGNTPLHYAAEKDVRFVADLLELGLSDTAYNNHGMTPLTIAVLNKKYSNVPLLKDAMFIRDNKYNGPIHYAIMANDKRMIKSLIENTPVGFLSSGLYAKSVSSCPEDYHLNYFTNAEYMSAISLAVSMLYEDSIRVLMEYKVDMNAKCNGKTPISILTGKRVRGDPKLLHIWSILTRDTDVYRNIGGGNQTGLLTNEFKFF